MRWARRAAWTVGVTVGALLLLVGALLLVLQTETGATTAAQWLAASANPLPNTQLTVERASGSWVRSLRLTNVTLTRRDTSAGSAVRMAHVDTLAVRYRLWPLLQGRLHVDRLSVAGPEATLRQAADSSWDWARVLPDSEPAPTDTSAAMPIRLDTLRVARGTFAAAFYAGGRDSTARIHDLEVRARDFRSASSITGRLDTLGIEGSLPGDTTALRLAARGGLTPSTLTLDTLRLDSPRSRVRGHGTVRLPTDSTDTLEDVSLSVQAAPLALRDLTLFAPTLDVDPRETVRLDTRVTGSGRTLRAAADARFSNGGTVTLRGAATPTTETTPEGPPLRYRLNTEVRSLTTSLLGPPDSTANRLNATLAADLEGRAVSALNGTASLRVTNTRWSGLRTPALTLSSTLRDGEASIDLQGTLNDARLRATGRARPLDEAPSANVTLQARALNVAAFAPNAGIHTDLAAAADLQAQALGTAGQTMDLTVTLDSSRIGVQRVVDGQATMALRPEQVRVGAGLTLPDGQLRAAGTAQLDGSERFVLETARFENVSVAALLGDTTASRVTGTARVDGRGYTPEAMQLDATLDLRNTVYGPYRLSALQTRAALSRGRLTTTTDATLNGSDWRLAVRGQPFASTPSFALTEGRFRNVDLGPFLQDTTQSSRLDGTVRGTVRGTDPQTMTAEAGLTLDTSRVNQQPIDTAGLTLRLAAGRLDTDLTLDTPDGGLRLAATARPFDATPAYRVTEGAFERLNVGALAGLPDVTTALTGGLSLEGRGTTANALTLDGRLSFTDSQINAAAMPEGTMSVSVENGQARADGQFAVAGGHVDVDASLDSLTTTPVYALRTTVDSLDAAALAGQDTLRARVDTLRWTLDGRGTDPATLTATTAVTAGRFQFDSLRVTATNAQGTLQRGRLTLETLRVQANAFETQGRGTLALTDTAAASDFSFRTEVTDAGALRRITGASISQVQRAVVETRVYGPSLAQQRFDGTVEVAGLAYEDVRLTEAELTFNGARGQEQWLRRMEVGGTLGYLSLPSLSVERTRLEARYDGTTIDLSSQVRLDPTHTADVTATVTPGADQTDVTLSQLDLGLDGNQWSLLRETTISINDQYRIRGLLLRSGDQQITADGVVDVNGQQSLIVTAEAVEMGSIAPLVGFSGVDGTLDGSLNLTGPATSPELESQLALDLETRGRAVGTLRLSTRYRDLDFSVNATLTHQNGRTLRATGSIPADLRLQAARPADVASRPVHIDVTTEQFPLDWVDPFLDPTTVRGVEGLLTAEVNVRGTLDAPKLAGKASLSGGAAYFPALDTRYASATASLQFAGDRVTLENAALRSSNNGELRAEGVINFPQLTVGEYNLDVRADDFLAIDTRAYRRAIVDGALTLRGTIQQPVLNGTVRLRNADIYYNEAVAEGGTAATAVQLTREDQLTLENRFGIRLSAADTTSFDAYEALEMDLTVEIQRNTWLRSESNPELNVQFTGDLDVTKASDAEPQIFGSIQVVSERSTLRQFGQEFQITEGTLTFNGDPYTPYLNLAAVYEQRAQGAQGTEVRITLALKGRPDELSPTLSSDPPMDTRNILSYLATGRPADELLSGDGGEGGGSLATQVALGQATNFVENLAASELGLDVVRVQLRPSGASYLTVGRYFTPRLFVSIQQPVTTSSPTSFQTAQYLPDLTVEYQLLDTLMLRALNNQQSFQLNLLFEYAY